MSESGAGLVISDLDPFDTAIPYDWSVRNH